MKKRIPFGVWEPDSNAILGNGRVDAAINVVPVKGGYRAIDGWDRAYEVDSGGNPFVTQPIVPENVINAISFIPENLGEYADFISTTTAIYKLDHGGQTAGVVTGSATTANQVGGNVAGDSAVYFRDMTQYGRVMIAASGRNQAGTAPIVAFTAGTGSGFLSLGTGFQADYVTTLRDFVVFASTYDSVDGQQKSRVRWSAFGDFTSYTPSAATQSDIQDLVPDYGPIKRVLGGNDVFVICENGVVLMEYVGSATVMRFTYIHKNIGTSHPLSCVRVGEYVYMYSQAGFVKVGKSPGDVTAIGEGRVDKEFDRRLIEGLTVVDNAPAVRAYHDESNACICWQYTASDGRAFAYSYRFDQWTHHGTSTDRSGAYFVYSSAIAQGAGGNSPYKYGRRRVPTAIGTNGVVYAQLNEAQKAKVQVATGYEELAPGRKSIVSKVWPVVDVRGGSLTNPEVVVTAIPKVMSTAVFSEPTSTYSSTASLQSDGFFTVTGPGSYEGKFHRFQLENSDTASERAGEQAILGIDVEFFERGNY